MSFFVTYLCCARPQAAGTGRAEQLWRFMETERSGHPPLCQLRVCVSCCSTCTPYQGTGNNTSCFHVLLACFHEGGLTHADCGTVISSLIGIFLLLLALVGSSVWWCGLTTRWQQSVTEITDYKKPIETYLLTLNVMHAPTSKDSWWVIPWIVLQLLQQQESMQAGTQLCE